MLDVHRGPRPCPFPPLHARLVVSDSGGMVGGDRGTGGCRRAAVAKDYGRHWAWRAATRLSRSRLCPAPALLRHTHTPPNSTRCAAARGSPTATLSRSGIGQSRATPANPPSSCDLVVPARPLEAVVDSSPNLRLASSVQGHVAWDPLAAHHSPNHYLTMQRHGQSRVVLTNPSSSCDPVASSTRGRRRLICLA